MTTRQERYATISQQGLRVLGSEVGAREWMGQLAIALDHQQMPASFSELRGAKLVDTHLDQIERGVYV